MIKPPQRITYRYEGGPLDGRTTYHALRPDDLSAKVLHRHTTCLKDADVDRTAAGIYHIEERGAPSSKAPLTAEVEEAIGLESLDESKPRQVEFVAVHHPSDQDEEWHVLKEKKEKDKKQDGPDSDLH